MRQGQIRVLTPTQESKLLWHTQELARMSQGRMRVLIPTGDI
jgi:hypothetical protein